MATTQQPINLAQAGSLSHLQWRATEWLYAFGPLREEIVLDYFALSPFYERGSNNEELKMQMHFARGGMHGVDVNEELKRFRGLQYKLEYSAPPGLFIIHRQQRTSETQATTTGVYYILNENVYQGPTLYTVLNERLLTAVHHMSKSISLIQDRKPTWTPTTVYEWDVKPPPAATVDSAAVTATSPVGLDPHSAPTADEPMAEAGSNSPAIVDDDAELPASTFNPLLYRALTGLAATLAPPPDQQQPAEPLASGTANNTAETPSQGVPEGAAANGGPIGARAGAAKEGAKAYRVDATGKRKPKKAS